MASTTTAVQAGPTAGGIVGAATFWVVAIGLAALTVWWAAPAWVWALRALSIVAGVGVAIWLILREKARERQGLPLDRDNTAVDRWTIAHTLAGVVMGAWGIPFVMVAVYTIAWEVFEYCVKGFGDKEIMSNRVVDVLVAWGGWFVLAGLLIAPAAHVEIPWLQPLVGSALRP